MKRIILISLSFLCLTVHAQFYEGRHKIGITAGQAYPVGDMKLQKAVTVEGVYNHGFASPGYILGANYSFLLFKHLELRGEFAYSNNPVDAAPMNSELNTIRPSARWTIDADAWKGMHFYGGLRYKFNLTQNQRLKGFAGLGLGLVHLTSPVRSIHMVDDTSDVLAKHKLISDRIAAKANFGFTYLFGKRWTISLEGGIMYSPAFFSNDYSKHYYRWTHPGSFKVPYSLALFELGLAYNWGKNPYVPMWDNGPQKKKTEQRMKKPGRKQKIRNRKKRGESGL